MWISRATRANHFLDISYLESDHNLPSLLAHSHEWSLAGVDVDVVTDVDFGIILTTAWWHFEFSRHLRDFSLVFTLQSSLDSYFDKRTLLPGPLCLFLKSQNLFCATTARKLGPQNSVLYDSQVPSVQHLNKYLGWMRLSEISIMCFSSLVSCKVNTCLHVTRSHTPDGAWVHNSYFCNRFSKEDQA